MLRTCFFCDAPLGSNDAVEHLPVGQRLAFDSARGRLWVVCLRCGRWSLTPFDQRWEATLECERLFRSTTVRLCTEQIGLARLPSGLDLVRIGDPVLPEFAAWRYGDELSRRGRRLDGYTLLKMANAPILVLGGPALAIFLGPAVGVAYAGAAAYTAFALHRRPVLTIRVPGGDSVALSHAHVRSAELIRAEDEAEHWAVWTEHLPAPGVLGLPPEQDGIPKNHLLLTGAEGRAATARILRRLNPLGGSRRRVDEALRWLQAGGGSEGVLEAFARSRWVRPALAAINRVMDTMHPEVRLALEMAVHEDEERRALHGELTILCWAWEREEALAAISDEDLEPVAGGPVVR